MSTLADFYSSHRSELVGIAYSLTGERDAANDIVQQAFTKTIAAIRRGDQVADLARWLNRVIRNLAADHHRDLHARPTESLWEDSHVDAHPEPPAFAELHDDCRAISDALGELTQKQREAILLTAVRGLNHEEAASVLDASVASVKQCIYRARQAIRASVGSGRETFGAILVWLVPGKGKPGNPGRLTRIRNNVGARLSGGHAPPGSPSIWDRMINAVVQPATSLVAAALVLAPIAILSGPAEAGNPSGNTIKPDYGKSPMARSAAATRSRAGRTSGKPASNSRRRRTSTGQNAANGQYRDGAISQISLPDRGSRHPLSRKVKNKHGKQHQLNDGGTSQGNSKTVHGQGDSVEQDQPSEPSQPDYSVSASPSEPSGQDEKTVEEPDSSGDSIGPAGPTNADPSGSEPDIPASGSSGTAPGPDGT